MYSHASICHCMHAEDYHKEKNFKISLSSQDKLSPLDYFNKCKSTNN